MPSTKRQPFTNRLAQIRTGVHLEKKYVASLLGHKNTSQISRFERGALVPDLKTALKLAQIYNIPVRVMLDEYYVSCRREIEEEKRRLTAGTKYGTPKELEPSTFAFCTYELLLTSGPVNEADLLKVRSHSTYLVRKSAEMLGHL